MIVVDVDSPENKLVFELDVQTYDGNKAVTPPQAYGAVVTYYRRYLYMVALDIVEADYLENNINPPEAPVETKVEAPKVVAKSPTPAPVTANETPLTDGNGQASELQIKQLKEILKKLLAVNPAMEEKITDIAIGTESFTKISKKECEELIKTATELIEKGGKV